MANSSELQVRVITPHDGTDAFRYAFTSTLRDWKFSRELAWRMFIRDTKATFRGSFLGWLWIILPTLANSLVWIFLSGSNVININTGSIPYPIFVLTGNLLWTAFSLCLTSGLGVLQEAQGTLSKVNFPHESLLLVALYKTALNVGITMLLLPPLLLLYPVEARWEILLFPVGVLVTMFCGLSVGLALLPFAALFQDLSRAVHLGMRFGFFLTPVVFPLPSSGTARYLMDWNPVTSLIVTSRAWLLGGETPQLLAFCIVSVISLFLFVVGLLAMKVA
ncbi:MAG: ABC transporter permease, partial [Planctomycetaceae bacterium]|nr:ABC transporter permease [Planctomycetaceae bacterium]